MVWIVSLAKDNITFSLCISRNEVFLCVSNRKLSTANDPPGPPLRPPGRPPDPQGPLPGPPKSAPRLLGRLVKHFLE